MLTALRSGFRHKRRVLVLVGLTMVAYGTAVNRGQTLPWFIAATLLATLVVSVAWPHWLVSRLAIRRQGPHRAQEGETLMFQVSVVNRGWLPRVMVELTDRVPPGARGDGAGGGAVVLGLADHVPGRGQRDFFLPFHCEKRGLYHLGPVGLASSFPLGLVEVRQQRDNALHELIVYPRVFPIVDLPLRGAPSQIHRGGYLLPEGAGSAEFSGLRDYRPGDNPKHIHWPTTARTGELMVRQFEPLASACVYLALDLSRSSNIGHGRHATLEYGASIAASIARFTCQRAIPTRMAGRAANAIDIPAGIGALHYQRILDELAVVDADGEIPYARLLEDIALEVRDGETVVVFLSHAAAETEDMARALSLLRARRAHLHAIVFDRSSFAAVAGEIAVAEHYAALGELDAHGVTVRKGDDLLRIFNA